MYKVIFENSKEYLIIDSYRFSRSSIINDFVELNISNIESSMISITIPRILIKEIQPIHLHEND